MTQQKTRAQLRSEAYLKADLTKDSSAIPTDLANVFVNEAWTELYDLIIAMDNARIFAKNAFIPDKLGQFMFKLPHDFYHLISVHVRRGEGYIPAIEADSAKYPELADNPYEFTRPQYFLREDPHTVEEFMFLMPDTRAEDIAIVYFPEPSVLDQDASQLANKGGRLEHVTLGAAIRMLDKIERHEQSQALRINQQKVEERIMNSITNRDLNNPRRIRDLSHRFDEDWGGYWR